MKKIDRFDGELYRRSKEAIAHGALTNSKRPEAFVHGIYPTHLKKGKGAYVWDSFNNQYIDFICGLGSNLIGHSNDDLNEAVIRQLSLGTSFSLGSELEVKVAERVKEFFPFIERIRFLKTGSEACTAAVRIAEAKTKRIGVISEGYHGWHGFKESKIPLNSDGSIIEDSLYEVAAVIVEPVITDNSQVRINFLKDLQKACKKTGALLIFDEVITGVRYSQYSVSQETDIIPDIICLGKALGGGLPLSIVAGKKEIMESDYFVSSTFAGETTALASCLKLLDLLQNKFDINHLWEKGVQFLFRFNEIWREGLFLQGYPTRSKFVGSPEVKALFMQECCRAGILIGPSFFFNFTHIDLMDPVLSTFSDILNRIKRGEVSLMGEMPQPSFSEKVRMHE